jgi:hypothetical protein
VKSVPWSGLLLLLQVSGLLGGALSPKPERSPEVEWVVPEQLAGRRVELLGAGLPGVGQGDDVVDLHVVGGGLAALAGAAYLRIDTIEQTILNRTSLVQPLGPVGYEVGYALAGEQLRLGTKTVVAECVNPIAITRDAWQRTAESAAAFLVDVGRHRVETRTGEIPGLTLPTWQQVSARQYEPWHRERLIVDTAQYGPDQCAAAIAEAVELAHAGPRT